MCSFPNLVKKILWNPANTNGKLRIMPSISARSGACAIASVRARAPGRVCVFRCVSVWVCKRKMWRWCVAERSPRPSAASIRRVTVALVIHRKTRDVLLLLLLLLFFIPSSSPTPYTLPYTLRWGAIDGFFTILGILWILGTPFGWVVCCCWITRQESTVLD